MAKNEQIIWSRWWGCPFCVPLWMTMKWMKFWCHRSFRFCPDREFWKSSSSLEWKLSFLLSSSSFFGAFWFWIYQKLKVRYLFLNKFCLFSIFCFTKTHDKFDRKIIESNQINQIESWRKHRCCAWVQKRVCLHWGSNSQPRAWHSEPMFRAKCDTTQLFRCP